MSVFVPKSVDLISGLETARDLLGREGAEDAIKALQQNKQTAERKLGKVDFIRSVDDEDDKKIFSSLIKIQFKTGIFPNKSCQKFYPLTKASTQSLTSEG